MRQMFILFELKYQPNDNRKIYKLTPRKRRLLVCVIVGTNGYILDKMFGTK